MWHDRNGGWTVTDHLLADVWDSLAVMRSTVWATVSTKPGQKPDIDAPRYPRPTDKKKKPKTSIDALSELIRAVGGA